MGFIKRVCGWLWIALIFFVLFLNLRLYSTSVLPENNGSLPRTILAQLNSNRSAIDNGAGAKMQALFPEGYYFCYALHGLTWVNVALRDRSFSERAIEEVEWCLNHLNSDEGKAPFPEGLAPERGMFYSSWKADLLAGMVLLNRGQDQKRLERLRAECDLMAGALRESPTPFLPSYIDQAWPCDTVPAIHAMKTYDDITGEGRFRDSIDQWLEETKLRLDPTTGLIPHFCRADNGQPIQTARATSQVIMLRFLADIEPEFADEQYKIFRREFYAPLLGLPGFREHPPQSSLQGGDVDSGPLVFGRSLSATVFGMGTAQVFGDQDRAEAISACGESVGLPWTRNDQKSYLAKVLPVGDVMVAYNHSSLPWLADQNRPSRPDPITMPEGWRWPTHAISSLFLLPVLIWGWRKYRRVRRAEHSED